MYFSEIFKKLNLRIGEKKRKYAGIFRIFLQISNSSSSYRFICLISFVFVFLWVMWAISVAKYLGFINLVIIDTATFLFVYCDKISIFVCFLDFILRFFAICHILPPQVLHALAQDLGVFFAKRGKTCRGLVILVLRKV